jgi:hypothetical protein
MKIKSYKLLATGFWLIGFIVFYTFLNGGFLFDTKYIMADTATTAADVANATPTVTVITPNASISLTEGVTAAATSTGTVQDNNGYADISAVTAIFFDDNVVNSDCVSDENNCYTGITCSTSTCSNTTCSVSCSADVWYYANATSSWKWQITADDGTATSSTSSTSVTINELVALDVTASISYGSVGLGETSSGATIVVTNTGNKDGLDATVSSASSMSCTTGSIAQSYQHYATSSSSFTYGNGVALSATSTSAGISIAQRTSTTSTENVYWKIQLPSSGILGTCSGSTVFTAN